MILDYKNNTLEQSENIDKYIVLIEEKKEILVNSIKELKEELSIINPHKVSRTRQGNLFEVHDEFIELAAYEVDDILCVGEKPYSLFMQDKILCELRSSGVTTIVNLMQEHEFLKYNSEVLHKEFKVINVPIIDNTPPSLEVLYKIIHIINSNKKTYIHCDLGLGRTGFVVAFYLYKKYAYKGLNILKRIKDLKLKSKFELNQSPSIEDQRKFVLELL
jgi:protein-tyrosine phosphatase